MSPDARTAPDRPVFRDPSLPTVQRVADLVGRLTLEEKVAQLSSAWEDVEPAGPEVAPGTSVLGVVGPLEETAAHGLGQLTRPYGTVPRAALEHATHYERRQRQVMAQSRFGIPAMGHDECLTGFTAFGATVYPTPLGMAATFDPDLVREVGAAIGADLAEAGVHLALAPVLDVVRDHRWGRCEETFGEDPFLVGDMAAAYVAGLQADGVGATLKHFAGYSGSAAGRNHAPVHVGRRELLDVFLPPFERVVTEGVASVMNSYADLDGVAPAASEWLLTSVLRDRWGFEGTVVSDYWSVPFLVTSHRVAEDDADAGVRALAAGMDVELPDQRGFGPALVGSVRSGAVSEDLVDRALCRVLTQKVEHGLLDPDWDPRPPGLRRGELDLDKPASRALARRVAEAGAVLLRDTGVLPLAGRSRVAVLGPCADDPNTHLGCYSFPNHVLSDRPELGLGVEVLTHRAALAAVLPDAEVTYAQGCPVREPDAGGIAAAVEAARAAEVVVLVVGDRPGMFGLGTSGEGCDVEDLRLPGSQQELVEAVLEVGRPTVVVVSSGRPYALGFVDERATLVQVFVPGEEGGPALANLLTGTVGFSGKLPVQVPRIAAGQPHTYLHAPLGGKQTELSNLDPSPLFPFGHGLTSTTFEVSGLSPSAAEVPTDGAVEVSVDVRNTGDRRGTETVQVYATDPVAQVARPVRSLLAYAKVTLDPGETTTVTFEVHTDRLAFAGLAEELVVEPGRVDLTAGSSSGDLPTTASVVLTGPLRTLVRREVHTVPWRRENGSAHAPRPRAVGRGPRHPMTRNDREDTTCDSLGSDL